MLEGIFIPPAIMAMALPGVGEDMAAWSSYAAAKRASKEREKFGKGSVDGLIAAETGDNAAIPGALIPALALGIPGSAPAAVLMAAMNEAGDFIIVWESFQDRPTDGSGAVVGKQAYSHPDSAFDREFLSPVGWGALMGLRRNC